MGVSCNGSMRRDSSQLTNLYQHPCPYLNPSNSLPTSYSSAHYNATINTDLIIRKATKHLIANNHLKSSVLNHFEQVEQFSVRHCNTGVVGSDCDHSCETHLSDHQRFAMQVVLVLCGFVSVAGAATVEYLFEREGQPSGGLEVNLPCAIACAQNSTCVWFTTVHGECSYKKEDGKRPSNHFKLVEMPNVS